MTPQKPFPPRTLAEALDYFAGADFINAINTARAEGRAEAQAELKSKKKLEMARMMRADGVSTELIVKYTSLSKEDIEKL